MKIFLFPMKSIENWNPMDFDMDSCFKLNYKTKISNELVSNSYWILKLDLYSKIHWEYKQDTILFLKIALFYKLFKGNFSYSSILKNFNLLNLYSTESLRSRKGSLKNTFCVFWTTYISLQDFHLKNSLFNFMRPKLCQWTQDICKCAANS